MDRLVQPLIGRLVVPLYERTGAGGSPPPDPGSAASLDFSDPANSQYIALLEDI